MSETVVVALVGSAIGWILRHVGVGAGIGGVAPASKRLAAPALSAGLTGGLKGEIEAIVAEAVKTAVAAAIADLRAGISTHAATPPSS
jgi:hypothetical protein